MQLLVYLLSIIIISFQVTEVNAGLFDFVPKVQSFLSNSEEALYKVASKFKASIRSLNSYNLEKASGVLSNVDKIASHVYKNVESSIINYNLFSDNFKMNNSLWNWIRGYPKNPCAKFNATALKFQIKHELFGQHLVKHVYKLLKGHFKKDKLKKPLIMSFHGQIGCGKTFVSKMIVDSLFNEGFDNKFVHVYHGSIDFPNKRKRKKEKYQERLRKDMVAASHMSDTSVFIFDEIDKMVPGVIDTLIPYISFYANSTTSSTNNIYIFLSNAGGKQIEDITYDAWFKGIPREEMILKNFSSVLKEAAYNEPGGLQYSEIVEKDFIDIFVPFLPLEKKHLKQCIVKELKLNKLSTDNNVVEKIAFQFEYYPPEFELFSVCGCKKVAYRVNIYGDTSL